MSHPLVITATLASKIIKLYIDGKILDEQIQQLNYAHEVIDTKISNKIKEYDAKLALFKKGSKAITSRISQYFKEDREIYELDFQKAQKLKYLYDICENKTIKLAIENELYSHIDGMIDKTANLGFVGGFLKNAKKLIN